MKSKQTEKNMDELVVNILNSMDGELSESQIKKLKNVLYIKMNDYNIDKECTELSVDVENPNLMALKMFLSTKKVEGKSEKTIDRYYKMIYSMLMDINKDIKDISTWDLRAYLAKYKEQRNVCDNTLDGMRRIFSSFFGWLRKECYLQEDPSERLQKIKIEKKVKQIITDEQFELLKICCKNDRDIAIINLLYVSGIRVGELVKLNISDVDFKTKSIIVHGKGNKQRKVYFDGVTKVRIEKYLASRNDSCPALFVTLRNAKGSNEPERIKIKGIEMRIRNIGREAGFDKIHAHKFRRTMATSMARKNVPVSKIAFLLGHEKISTTQEYLVNIESDVENSYRMCFD